ncbi:protein SON-like [Tropilaelaps mercedesae]|uniref:Protein SON-like n=1 Tax=Tropilaelaps mercedesae TaxID=418985 RepID=A0A1V9XY48_9ACAR|nr:protein SON-like [Tropilaelaps mercedesae]
MSEDSDTSSSIGGKQFDVSNILADYFKDKIRQGIGGEARDSSGDNASNRRLRDDVDTKSPERKRIKKEKKSKKKRKKEHKQHSHMRDRASHDSKDSLLRDPEESKEYSKSSGSAPKENDSRAKGTKDKVREKEKVREWRSDRRNDSRSSDKVRHRSRPRDRDGKCIARRERRSGRDRSQSCSRSRDRRRDRSRSSGRFRSPLRVRESVSRGGRTGEGRNSERDREDNSACGFVGGFDKKELLEVAKRNVKVMIQTGTLPKGVDVEKLGLDLSKEEASSTAESVDKFTEICRKIQETGDDDEATTATRVSHPFEVKERPIRMNIPNAVQLPAKSFQEKIKDTAALTAQFPVSSGSTHRKNEIKELDWKPVKKNKDDIRDNKGSKNAASNAVKKEVSAEIVPLSSETSLEYSGNAARPVLSVAPIAHREDLEETLRNMTIPQVMTKRVEALQKLQKDPADPDAKKLHETTEKVIRDWSRSKQQPGQLTNSVDTTVKFLSPAELQEGPQAWVKKDQLQKARAVEGGIGMALLQKMGWKPGTALGKNREGALEPLLPSIKMDRKGLVAQEEAIAKDISVNVAIPNRSARANAQLQEVQATSLGGKHPVSALIELCTAQKTPAPEFVEMPAFGPDHKKTFLYKVIVNGKSYQPVERSPNKKLAKAAAALVALNEMGAVVWIEKGPRMSLIPQSTDDPSRPAVPTDELSTKDMFQPLKCTDPSKMASNFLTSFNVTGVPRRSHVTPLGSKTTPQKLSTPQPAQVTLDLPYSASLTYSLWPNVGSSAPNDALMRDHVCHIQGHVVGSQVYGGLSGETAGPSMVAPPNQDGISAEAPNGSGVSQFPSTSSTYGTYFTGGQLCTFYGEPYSSYGSFCNNGGDGSSFAVVCEANTQRVHPMPTAVVAPSGASNPNLMSSPKT